MTIIVLVTRCLAMVAVSQVSLANAQDAQARVEAATAAVRAVRKDFPAGEGAIVYRADSAFALSVARQTGFRAAPVRGSIDCVKGPHASACLLNRVRVTLEIFSADVKDDFATVFLIVRSKSDDPMGFHFITFKAHLQRVRGVWVVRQVIPGGFS